MKITGQTKLNTAQSKWLMMLPIHYANFYKALTMHEQKVVATTVSNHGYDKFYRKILNEVVKKFTKYKKISKYKSM